METRDQQDVLFDAYLPIRDGANGGYKKGEHTSPFPFESID